MRKEGCGRMDNILSVLGLGNEIPEQLRRQRLCPWAESLIQATCNGSVTGLLYGLGARQEDEGWAFPVCLPADVAADIRNAGERSSALVNCVIDALLGEFDDPSGFTATFTKIRNGPA